MKADSWEDFQIPGFWADQSIGDINGVVWLRKKVIVPESMIHPLHAYKIKGGIWYQRESNAGSPHDYQSKLSTMIKDWRSKWVQGDFPFLIVRLANFMEEERVMWPFRWPTMACRDNYSKGHSTSTPAILCYDPQEITVGNQSIINITMKDAVEILNQVIVVGYGTQRKEDLTGAVSVVNTD